VKLRRSSLGTSGLHDTQPGGINCVVIIIKCIFSLLQVCLARRGDVGGGGGLLWTWLLQQHPGEGASRRGAGGLQTQAHWSSAGSHPHTTTEQGSGTGEPAAGVIVSGCNLIAFYDIKSNHSSICSSSMWKRNHTMTAELSESSCRPVTDVFSCSFAVLFTAN